MWGCDRDAPLWSPFRKGLFAQPTWRVASRHPPLLAISVLKSHSIQMAPANNWEQCHGIKTWPFPSDGDSTPTGHLAVQWPLGLPETVSWSGGFVRTVPASSHFLSQMLLPATPQTLCTPNSVLVSQRHWDSFWGIKTHPSHTANKWHTPLFTVGESQTVD